MSKTYEQWINFAKQKHRSIFFFEQKVLDLTQFMLIHPGGKKALTNYIFKDITQILFKVYPHKKDDTLKVLFKYNLGSIKNKTPIKRSEQKTPKGDQNKQKKRVCFKKTFICQNPNDSSADEANSIMNFRKGDQKAKNEGQTSSSKNKNLSKNKQNVTSIKLIKQKIFEQDETICNNNTQKGSYSKPVKLSKTSLFDEQADQQKPIFRVPILNVKHMNGI